MRQCSVQRASWFGLQRAPGRDSLGSSVEQLWEAAWVCLKEAASLSDDMFPSSCYNVKGQWVCWCVVWGAGFLSEDAMVT
jgi:hypothetical protein